MMTDQQHHTQADLQKLYDFWRRQVLGPPKVEILSVRIGPEDPFPFAVKAAVLDIDNKWEDR